MLSQGSLSSRRLHACTCREEVLLSRRSLTHPAHYDNWWFIIQVLIRQNRACCEQKFTNLHALLPSQFFFLQRIMNCRPLISDIFLVKLYHKLTSLFDIFTYNKNNFGSQVHLFRWSQGWRREGRGANSYREFLHFSVITSLQRRDMWNSWPPPEVVTRN